MNSYILRAGILVFGLLVANFAFSAPINASSVQAKNETSVEIQQIKDVINKYILSIETLDQKLAEEVWDTSTNATFIHPRGHEKTWNIVWQDFYINSMGRFYNRKLAIHDLQIYLHGNAAYVEFYWNFEANFKKDGSEIKTAGRENQLLVLTDKGWKISHIHYSNMPVTGERQGF